MDLAAASRLATPTHTRRRGLARLRWEHRKSSGQQSTIGRVAMDQNRSLLRPKDRNSVLSAVNRALSVVSELSKGPNGLPFFVGVCPLFRTNSESPRDTPRVHDATRDTYMFYLWHLCCIRKNEALTARLLHAQTQTQKGRPRALPRARPFPYRPLLSASREYHPSPADRTGQSVIWPVHRLGMPPLQPWKCLGDR